MKLNLGCGQNRLDGYVNADREPAVEPDVVMDMEDCPWPFDTGSVDEVVASHVLEHVGADPQAFIRIMQELYRVCRGGAIIHVAVPHPRHDSFLGDPTHVRAVTPTMLALFSKRNCAEFKKAGAANTPLAVYAGVDFEMVSVDVGVEPAFAGHPDLEQMKQHWYNVATEYRMVLKVIK